VKPTAAAGARLVPLDADALDGDDRAALRGRLAAADRYLTGAPDAPPMPGILGLFAHHPQLGGDWLAFSAGLLDAPALDPRDRELVVLRVAHRAGCRYEWAQHARIALDVGVTEDQISSVTGPLAEGFWEADDLALLEAVDQLVDGHRIEDATWGRLTLRFDQRQLLELLFVAGSYLCLALVLNSAGLEPDPVLEA
jgi:4-carboxymuconolactone decarboxylase